MTDYLSEHRLETIFVAEAEAFVCHGEKDLPPSQVRRAALRCFNEQVKFSLIADGISRKEFFRRYPNVKTAFFEAIERTREELRDLDEATYRKVVREIDRRRMVDQEVIREARARGSSRNRG